VTSPDLHIGLVPDIKDAKVALVFCCGDMTRYLFDALPEALRGGYAFDGEELASLAVRAVDDGDIVIVKGAKSLKMGRVVDALKALDVPAQQKVLSA
jgi:UDP-N-acetylmuramoyl-tripeptide--D-alanyl-D-alanine ligase